MVQVSINHSHPDSFGTAVNLMTEFGNVSANDIFVEQRSVSANVPEGRLKKLKNAVVAMSNQNDGSRAFEFVAQ